MAKKPKKNKNKAPWLKDRHLDLIIYTPSRLKEKFAFYNADFNIRIPLITLAAVMGFGAVCCYAFQLKAPYIIVVELAAMFFSPGILVAILNEKNEHRRFDDLNSYMQQFISGMILHKRILAALKDTSVTFINGQMHNTLETMLTHIENAKEVRIAERQAFLFMENTYPNTQSGMLHDFALRVESRGGEFEEEMDMLNKKREKWEKRTEHCQNQMKVTVYSSLLLYACMILVCALVQHSMPEQLSIIDTTLSQISETILIISFFFFVYLVEKHMAKGWLTGENFMNDTEAKQALDYLELFDRKFERRKGLIAGSIALVMSAGLLYLTRNVYVSVFCILVVVAAFNLHNIIRLSVLNNVKKNLRAAVPRWLFDVCLLMQKNNITISVTDSVRTAPPILKRDIVKFLNKLKKNPSDVKPYLEFLEQYNLPNVRTTMRMLISIQNGAAGDSKMQMSQLIEHNMNMLDEIDATETELRNAGTVRYNIYPMIPSTIVMGGYLLSMIIKIFTLMGQML